MVVLGWYSGGHRCAAAGVGSATPWHFSPTGEYPSRARCPPSHRFSSPVIAVYRKGRSAEAGSSVVGALRGYALSWLAYCGLCVVAAGVGGIACAHRHRHSRPRPLLPTFPLPVVPHSTRTRGWTLRSSSLPAFVLPTSLPPPSRSSNCSGVCTCPATGRFA